MYFFEKKVKGVGLIVKIFHWVLLFLSAFLYALPFICTYYLWWLVFFFPIPLLYIICTQNLSFVHGYIWGVVTFLLHVYGGIYVISCMAGKSWPIGLLLGITVVLYQALSVAILFWCATLIARYFSLKSTVARLFLWATALMFFIMWTDWYCLWIFGIKEGYPLMHPLIPLAQHPQMLLLLPIIGKLLLTVLFLLFSVSSVAVIRLCSWSALLMLIMVCMPWIWCWCSNVLKSGKPSYVSHIKSIPFMTYSSNKNPVAMMKIACEELRALIAQYPGTNIIIMPESALNCTVFGDRSELLQFWNEQCIGKVIHLIFGSFRYDDNGNYYNTAYWVYNGQLQQCFDKRHAVLISERLAWLSLFSVVKDVYSDAVHSTTISGNDRLPIVMADCMTCVPYICSELFFNEYPDDMYKDIAIIALVNDTAFLRSCASYIADLLLQVACVKAIAWQRDIIYVSYSRSLCIDRYGTISELNE